MFLLSWVLRRFSFLRSGVWFRRLSYSWRVVCLASTSAGVGWIRGFGVLGWGAALGVAFFRLVGFCLALGFLAVALRGLVDFLGFPRRLGSSKGKLSTDICLLGWLIPVAARSGSAGAQGTAGSDQPILRLSHRDPGVTVERHPASPLAGIVKVYPSCRVEINRVFQPPPELRQGGISSRGRKQGCFQPGPPAGAGPDQPSGLRDHAAGPVVQQHHGGEVHRPGNRAGASRW